MIRDALADTEIGRKDTDQIANEAVRSGEEQFTFLLENNPEIKGQLAWFQSTIQQWDQASQKDLTKQNRMEHVGAWALQRDVNYAYSDRYRLLCIGQDSRFEEAYQAGFRAEVSYGPS